MITIKWPDGVKTSASNYVALIRAVKYDQWDNYPTARDMCAELLRRAEMVTARSLRHVEADVKATLDKLVALGLIEVEVN